MGTNETTFTLDVFEGGKATKQRLADELRRIADPLDEGFQDGEVYVEGSRGWWKTTAADESDVEEAQDD